jgi:hypothetical protein
MSTGLLLRVRSTRDPVDHDEAFDCPFTSLFRSTDTIDALVDHFGVSRVSSFCAVDAEEAASLLREMGIEPDTAKITPITWHPVENGLATFSAVRANIDQYDLDPDFKNELLAELDILIDLFTFLKGDNATFYFHIDA